MTSPNDPTERVLVALRELGGEGTASELKAKTGLGKDAVSKALKTMAETGEVSKHGGGVIGVSARWRIEGGTIAATLRRLEDEEARAASNLPHGAVDATTDAGVSDTPGDPVTTPTGGIGDVAAWMRDERPVPEPTEEEKLAEENAGKAPKTPKEPARGTCTQCGQPMHKEGRSWVHDVATDALVEGAEHKATSKAVREPSQGDGQRRGKGELQAQIESFLRANAGQAFTSGEVAKGINFKWSGTTGKTLERCVELGTVKHAENEGRARKYQAA